MAKEINQYPPLTAEQHAVCLLLQKLVCTGDLTKKEWRTIKNAGKDKDTLAMSLEEFIATWKAELPAYLYRLTHKTKPISDEELGLWCLTNNLPID
jgi:hypothetical protein